MKHLFLAITLLFLSLLNSQAEDSDSLKNRSFYTFFLNSKAGNTAFQAGLAYNHTFGTVKGLQFNVAVNSTGQLRGAQIAGFTNITGDAFRGLQLSGITNIAMGVEGGLQLSGLANVSSGRMDGVQIGGYNYADTLRGVQIGLINVADSHPTGVQVGLINFSHDTEARKFGLVNINPKTRIDILAFGGNTSKMNAALRFRNRSTYNIIGGGTHYMGLDKRFSGALFYRFGQYFNLTPRWSISGDLGYYHIETFEDDDITKPERLYSLQAHLNVDYQINRNIGVFGSVGYGNTRHYGGGKYKDGLIGQVGLSVNLHRSSAEETNAFERKKILFPNYGDSLCVNKKSSPNYWGAALETTGINLFVHLFDRFPLNKDYAQVGFKDIKHNFQTGFVWDNDEFSTNLSAHPYHGNLYFNSARSNGLSFWESTPYALGGSLMWEFLGETEPPAINDVLATTFGGIALGEVTHRVSQLFLNDRKRGFNRFLREAAATIINPMGGLHRIVSGDAWHVRQSDYLYYDRQNLPINLAISAGTRYLSDDGALFRGEFNPYINIFLEYGDPLSNRCRKPYDYFTVETTVGLSGNQPLFNRIHLLGRLWGKSIEGRNSMAEIGMYQHFNYYNSEPVKDGTQLTPYRISEAAAVGPGLIIRFPQTGSLMQLEQRIFLSGILLGGSKSDYYAFRNRDYNMGSGFSVKTKTHMELRQFGRFILRANYFRLFTWKGYENKDYENIDPIYLNVQGDKGNAQLLEVNSLWEYDFKGPLSLSAGASYFYRNTHYKHHEDVYSHTFETNVGLTYHF